MARAAAGEPQVFEWCARDLQGRTFWVENPHPEGILQQPAGLAMLKAMDSETSGKFSHTSAYLQIANVLRAQIVSEADLRRRRLPSEQELAKIHGVARGTIHSALDVLAQEGLISRTPRQPTMTIPDGIRAYQRLRHRRAIVVIAAADLTSPQVPSGYMGQVYQGILTAGERAGYRCVPRWVQGQFVSHELTQSRIAPDEVLGAINLHILDNGLFVPYLEAGLPVVCVDFWPVHPGIDAVVVDCFGEAHQAVEFLLSNGHRELFFVGNTLGHGAMRRPEADSLFMESGYRCATRMAGLTASTDRVFYCRSEESEDLFQWFCSLRPRPTAGIIFNTYLMEPFLAVLRRHGVRCPEDVSLVTKACEDQPIKAASVCTDAFGLGRFAAELLIGRATGKYVAGMRVAFASRIKRGPTVRTLPL